MKIAMIGHKRIPSREGGVEIVVEELSVRMAAMGHQVDVYNRKGKNVADKDADREAHKLKSYKGVRLFHIPTLEKKSLNAILYAFNATVKALFGCYDVIHYHAEGPCAMLPLAHFFGIRTVATIHGLDWQRAKWGGFATKFLLFGEKMAAKYADEIVVLSQNVQKYFKDTYNRDTHFVPNGVNIPEKKEAQIISEKYGLSKDSYILFLARLVPEKGVHYLLDAFAQIQTDKKLVIAGGASHSSEYVTEIKEKAAKDSRVIMTGFVQGRELEELFSNCYLYVLPSDIEGMPISLLEAMSYGCSCLISDIEENVEVAGKFAARFEKSNVSSLKDALSETLREKQDRSEELISHVRQQYNWDAVAERTVELYKRP